MTDRQKEVFFPFKAEVDNLDEYAERTQKEIAVWRGKDTGKYGDLSSYPDWPDNERNPLEVDVIGGRVAGIYLQDLYFRPGMEKPSIAFHFIALALKYGKPIVLDSVEDERTFETMLVSDNFSAVLGSRKMLTAGHDVQYWREKARQLARPGRLAAARTAPYVPQPAPQAAAPLDRAYIAAFSDEAILGGRNAVGASADGAAHCAAFKKLAENGYTDFAELLDALERGSAILAGLKKEGLNALYLRDVINRMVVNAADMARNNRPLLDELVKRMLGLSDLNSRRLLCYIILRIGDHVAVMDSVARLAGIGDFNFNATADISGGKFREGTDYNNAIPGFNALFRNKHNLANLARLAAALRMVYAYDLVLPVKEGGRRIDGAPFEFAYQKDRNERANIAIRLFRGPDTTLWLTPVTGSFRRSVVFATENKTGEVVYSVEMKMDGELETKRSLPLNAIALEDDLKKLYGEGYDDIMHPIAEIALGKEDLPEDFTLYNQLRDKLNVMLIEHDPKAVRLIYGKRAPALHPEVCRLNAIETLKILLKFQLAVYVGSADSRPGNDVHPENFLMSSASRLHRVRQVCDVADLTKETPASEFQFYADIASTAQSLARIEAAAMLLDDGRMAEFAAQNAGKLQREAINELKGDFGAANRQDLLDRLAGHEARLEKLDAAAKYITDLLKPLPASAEEGAAGDASFSSEFRGILKEIVEWNIKLTGEDRFYGREMPLVVVGTVSDGLFAVDSAKHIITVDRGLVSRRGDPECGIALKIGLMQALFAEAGVEDQRRYITTVFFINSLLREANMPVGTFVTALKDKISRPAPLPARPRTGAIEEGPPLPALRPETPAPAAEDALKAAWTTYSKNFTEALQVSQTYLQVRERKLLHAYHELLAALLPALERDGGPATFVYPFMGPDIIPALYRLTVPINDTLDDISIGVEKCRTYGIDTEKIRLSAPAERDAFTSKAYDDAFAKARKAAKGPCVFIIKGIERIVAGDSAKRVLAEEIMKHVFSKMDKGDKVLILTTSDRAAYRRLAGDDFKEIVGPLEVADALEHPWIEGEKVLMIPNGVTILEKTRAPPQPAASSHTVVAKEDENDAARRLAKTAARLLTGREGDVYRAGSRVFEINGKRIESQEILSNKPDDFRFYHIGPFAFIMPYDGFGSMSPAPSHSDVLKQATEGTIKRVSETL